MADTPRNVYVSVPVEVANKAANMTKITKDVLGKLGCAACHSGYNIKFILEKQQDLIKFNANLEGKATKF